MYWTKIHGDLYVFASHQPFIRNKICFCYNLTRKSVEPKNFTMNWFLVHEM